MGLNYLHKPMDQLRYSKAGTHMAGSPEPSGKAAERREEHL